MASAINNGTFTFNPEELKDWAKVINELTFNDPALTSLHDIEQGIKYKQQIVFAGKIGLLGKKIADCTPSEIAGITLAQKFWEPTLEDFRLKQCSADVNQQDKLVNQYAKVNPDFYNIIEGSQSTVGDFLVASVLEAVKENIFWKVWFDDKNASTFEDSDGSNTFTNGTDVTYFTGFDGLFKQIFTEIGSGVDGGKYFTSITKNAGASYALQALASGDAIAVFKSAWNKADSRLRGMAGAKFMVTRSLYDGLVNDLEATQNTGGFTQTNEGGMSVLRYRGVEVVMVELWDRFIDAYQNNGTKWNIPHRLVLSVPMNLKIGTPSEGDSGTVDAFYDRVTKQNYIDGAYGLDAKFMEPYLASVAY